MRDPEFAGYRKLPTARRAARANATAFPGFEFVVEHLEPLEDRRRGRYIVIAKCIADPKGVVYTAPIV